MPEMLLDGRVELHAGDSLAFLRDIPDNWFDSIVTDPPYALVSIGKRFGADGAAPVKVPEGGSGAYARASAGFMGKKWDTGETAFAVEFWAQCLRVLKPGGHVVAFGGTRTYHRLAVAIEDAGFEIRDMISWTYGSGFPKSHDVSKGIDKAAGAERKVLAKGAAVKRMIPGADQNKAGWEKSNGREYVPEVTAAATAEAAEWEGWGTALKPAVEPICLARKPLIGTVAENVLRFGVGALNVDGCRVETDENLNGGAYAADGGRVAMSGDDREGAALGMFQPGKTVGSGFEQPRGRWPANLVHDGSAEVLAAFPETTSGLLKAGTIRNSENKVYGKGMAAAGVAATDYDTGGDSGSAARFYYTAKADSDDRLGSKHPTVKPVDLMQWLVRLVTPKGGLVLDPFAGTGTTAEACFREGMRCMLVEREVEYQEDIRRRMSLVLGGPDERRRESIKAKTKGQAIDLGPLFGGIL